MEQTDGAAIENIVIPETINNNNNNNNNVR
jgi:hypothetical protein